MLGFLAMPAKGRVMTPSTACSALAFLLLLFGALVVVKRRRFGGWRALWRPAAPAGRRLRVVETLALDPRRRLMLLDCAGCEMVVLVGGGNDLLLGQTGLPFAPLVAEQMS